MPNITWFNSDNLLLLFVLRDSFEMLFSRVTNCIFLNQSMLRNHNLKTPSSFVLEGLQAKVSPKPQQIQTEVALLPAGVTGKPIWADVIVYHQNKALHDVPKTD